MMNNAEPLKNLFQNYKRPSKCKILPSKSVQDENTQMDWSPTEKYQSTDEDIFELPATNPRRADKNNSQKFPPVRIKSLPLPNFEFCTGNNFKGGKSEDISPTLIENLSRNVNINPQIRGLFDSETVKNEDYQKPFVLEGRIAVSVDSDSVFVEPSNKITTFKPLDERTNQEFEKSNGFGNNHEMDDKSDIARDFISSERDADLLNTESMPALMKYGSDRHINRIHSVPNFYDGEKPVNLIGERFNLVGPSKQLLIGDLSREHTFPILPNSKNDLVYMSVETLFYVIGSDLASRKDDIIIIDCRYPYEYNAGHIVGALNLYTPNLIIDYFFTNNKNVLFKKSLHGDSYSILKSPILIFHCEYSSHRAPKIIRFIRNKDRNIHNFSYPKLFYPEIYVLEGGYRSFFAKYKDYCEPQNYVEMNDAAYSSEERFYSRELRKAINNSWSSSSKSVLRPRSRYYAQRI